MDGLLHSYSRNLLGAFILLAALDVCEADAERRALPLNQSLQPAYSSQFQPLRIYKSSLADPGKLREILIGFHGLDSISNLEETEEYFQISQGIVEHFLKGASPLGKAGADPGISTTENPLPAASLRRVLKDKFNIELEPAGAAHALYHPDDPQFAANQWAIHNTGQTLQGKPGKAGADVNAVGVWDKFSGHDTLVIAVIDGGFNFKHPDMQGRNWINVAEAKGIAGKDDDGNGFIDDSLGWDFVEGDNYPQDYQGHGTQVSSVISANFDNGQGMAGVLPECKIMPVRVLDATGHGNQDMIAKGVHYAVNNGAHVINFSIGGSGDHTGVRTAFQSALKKGVPIVLAAGNDSQDVDAKPTYPVAYQFANMVVVAAHDHAAELSAFSNYGKNSVHLAAPGEMVFACGVPPRMPLWSENFEENLDAWQPMNNGDFQLSRAVPLAGAQSLAWAATRNTSVAGVGYLDLTGQVGASLSFLLEFQPGNNLDLLIVEGNREGTSVWTEIAVIGSKVTPARHMDFALKPFEGAKFKLRFRTYTRYSSYSSRLLKLDDLSMHVFDPDPATQDQTVTLGGTSIAAPYVTAYVGLLKLACDRTGQPFDRAKILAGVTAVPALQNLVSSGGMLNMKLGLDFYLNTLPGLTVSDSTLISWKENQRIEYSLQVEPDPSKAYKLQVGGQPAGAQFDIGTGKWVWTPFPTESGGYTLKILGIGPTLLRKKFSFTVLDVVQGTTGLPILTFSPSPAQRSLRLGKQKFSWSVRPGGKSSLLRIRGYDGSGRAIAYWEGSASEFKDTEVEVLRYPVGPNMSHSPQFPVGYRAWLDEIPLISTP